MFRNKIFPVPKKVPKKNLSEKILRSEKYSGQQKFGSKFFFCLNVFVGKKIKGYAHGVRVKNESLP